jgi:hypothetical protein
MGIIIEIAKINTSQGILLYIDQSYYGYLILALIHYINYIIKYYILLKHLYVVLLKNINLVNSLI